MAGKEKKPGEEHKGTSQPRQQEQEDFGEGENFADINPGSTESGADIKSD